MIDQPGIFTISAKEYHADPCPEPSLSASVANILLQKSPAHARLAHPRLYAGHEAEESERFDIGTAAHALLLERDDSNIVWVPHNDWRTAAARTARIDARAQGKLPILSRYQGVLDRMCMVARQAVNDSELEGLWDNGKPEMTAVWQDEGEDVERRPCDVWCRARPDWLTTDRSIILDYKSSESAEPEFAIRQIGRLGHDVSAEFYLRGMNALGFADTKYVFLFQEIEPPFACSFVSLANSYREIAADKVERAINAWRMCLASGNWPAYRLDIHWAEPSNWQLQEYEARLDSAGRTW